MTWGEIKLSLDIAMSDYSTKRGGTLRSGKYTTGDHWKDGYIAMVFKTLKEISPINEMYPMDEKKVKRLIWCFNNLTSGHVENVWSD